MRRALPICCSFGLQFLHFAGRPSFRFWNEGRIGSLNSEQSMTAANNSAVRRALEAAGVEFIEENSGGLGVRLRQSQRQERTK
jgi:hypothetical protein